MFCFKFSAKAILLVLFLFSTHIVSGFTQSPLLSPIWMKEGAYVEYTFGEGIRFSSSTNSTAYEGGTYKWECIEINGTLAKLNLSLSYNGKDDVTQFLGELLVDTVNRSVYNLDGSILGTTLLWLKTNPFDGEKVILWNVPPDKIFGIVEANRVSETLQGNQESYKVHGNGTIANNTAVFNTRYDQNTGLMIRGLLWNEGTLNALNTGILNSLTISDTNIDLGPSTDVFDFTILLPIVIGTSFVFIFFSIYWKQSKKSRSTHKHLELKWQ